MFSVLPIHAVAPPIRPPCFRYSSVLTAHHIFVSGRASRTRATTSTNVGPARPPCARPRTPACTQLPACAGGIDHLDARGASSPPRGATAASRAAPQVSETPDEMWIETTSWPFARSGSYAAANCSGRRRRGGRRARRRSPRSWRALGCSPRARPRSRAPRDHRGSGCAVGRRREVELGGQLRREVRGRVDDDGNLGPLRGSLGPPIGPLLLNRQYQPSSSSRATSLDVTADTRVSACGVCASASAVHPIVHRARDFGELRSPSDA